MNIQKQLDELSKCDINHVSSSDIIKKRREIAKEMDENFKILLKLIENGTVKVSVSTRYAIQQGVQQLSLGRRIGGALLFFIGLPFCIVLGIGSLIFQH